MVYFLSFACFNLIVYLCCWFDNLPGTRCTLHMLWTIPRNEAHTLRRPVRLGRKISRPLWKKETREREGLKKGGERKDLPAMVTPPIIEHHCLSHRSSSQVNDMWGLLGALARSPAFTYQTMVTIHMLRTAGTRGSLDPEKSCAKICAASIIPLAQALMATLHRA